MVHFRKKLLFILLVGVISMLLNCSKNKFDVIGLKQEIKELTSDFPNVTVAVAFEDLQSGNKFFINEKVQMHAASLMKIPVMIEVFKQAEKGKFSLTDSLEIKNEFNSIVDGSKFSLLPTDDSDKAIYQHLGNKMSIRDLLYRMITVSSNLATNQLIELVGAENVTHTMRLIGAKDIQILRGVEDIKEYRAGLNNTTNAYDMYVILKKIAKKQIVAEEACEEMIGILSRQRYRDKIPRFLPQDVRVANKTGWITGIDHDAAIVYLTPEHFYVLVVLTENIENHAQAQKLIGRISRKIFDEIQNTL